MIHCRLSWVKWSFSPIVGNATFTIETSRTVIKNAAPTTARVLQRFGSSAGAFMVDLPAACAALVGLKPLRVMSQVPAHEKGSRADCRALVDERPSS